MDSKSFSWNSRVDIIITIFLLSKELRNFQQILGDDEEFHTLLIRNLLAIFINTNGDNLIVPKSYGYFNLLEATKTDIVKVGSYLIYFIWEVRVVKI